MNERKEYELKKSLMLASVLILICGMVGAANAAPYAYSDLIDYWNFSGTSYSEYQDDSHYWDSVSLSENDALSYTHNLNDDVNFAGGDLVTSANLELDFTNDFNGCCFYRLACLASKYYRTYLLCL